MDRLLLTIFLVLVYMFSFAQTEEDYASLRSNMVAEVENMVVQTRDYLGKDKLDSRVIDALKNVARHEFVPDIYDSYAYENRPLPIGQNQTISQPYIVALMTDLAQVDKDSNVLEVGTGSGYQAAVLAELANHVYSIEIIEALGRNAQKVLYNLGYTNITVRIGDGYNGWIEHAPFDAIIVTAAPEKVPQPLIDQLKPGGRLIIPVGSQGRSQSLQVLIKDESGEVLERNVLPVGFVPLTRME